MRIRNLFVILLLAGVIQQFPLMARTPWSADWKWAEWYVRGPCLNGKPHPKWKFRSDREYQALIPAFEKVYVRKDQVIDGPFGQTFYADECGNIHKVDTVLADYDGLYVIKVVKPCSLCGGYCKHDISKWCK